MQLLFDILRSFVLHTIEILSENKSYIAITR